MKQNRKEKGNVPNLRFPEFEGEWEEKKLRNVADIIGGGTPDTTIEKYWNGEIQWFTPTEIKSNYVSKSERTITKQGLNKSSAKILPVGTILLTTRATIGEVAITIEECTTNQGFQSLVIKKDVNNIFIPSLSKETIEKIQICIPDVYKQENICSILDSVNYKVQIERNILSDYLVQKKYILKKMFI
jgi:Restriction endonuclease S subunits